ncbi:hypothetical protein [Microvirga sp. KLBC 81]|uniref:hypothetical protein n=1 Tax=Microvirga sp. KLBC 81 TaxID=1862707 RepID=UPI001057D935|nr:hypothetical protein [Microvirga sp. KLBC 81]
MLGLHVVAKSNEKISRAVPKQWISGPTERGDLSMLSSPIKASALPPELPLAHDQKHCLFQITRVEKCRQKNCAAIRHMINEHDLYLANAEALFFVHGIARSSITEQKYGN